MEQQLSILGGPAAFVQINGLTVPVYEIAEQLCLLSRDVGKVLGYRQPSQALSHLRRRYRQELASHVYRAWVRTTGNGRKKTVWLISVEGCETLAGKSFQKNAMAVQRQFEALRRQRKPQEKIAMEEKILDLGVLGQQEVGSDAEETAPAESVSQEETDVSSMETLPVVDGPVKVVEFHGQEVPVYEVNGDLYLTGEDLGKILGLADHRDSVNNIFNRHRPELDMHSTTIKLRGRDWKARSVRLYSQDGCYLISMFARTDTAKDVRQWLAALPRQVRQIQAIAPELLAQVRQDDIEEVAFRMLNLLNTPAGSKIGLKKMERLTRLRAKGLVTQKEASKMHEISVEAARHIEREMGAMLGLEIKPINPFERDREMNRAFATMLAKSFAMDLEATVATPATPREKKKMH